MLLGELGRAFRRPRTYILGFGLLISTYAETQQQAQSLTFFFVMIFNLMSGLFTPIDSMPEWAQWITWLIPISYFINGGYLPEVVTNFLCNVGWNYGEKDAEGNEIQIFSKEEAAQKFDIGANSKHHEIIEGTLHTIVSAFASLRPNDEFCQHRVEVIAH